MANEIHFLVSSKQSAISNLSQQKPRLVRQGACDESNSELTSSKPNTIGILPTIPSDLSSLLQPEDADVAPKMQNDTDSKEVKK